MQGQVTPLPASLLRLPPRSLDACLHHLGQCDQKGQTLAFLGLLTLRRSEWAAGHSQSWERRVKFPAIVPSTVSVFLAPKLHLLTPSGLGKLRLSGGI